MVYNVWLYNVLHYGVYPQVGRLRRGMPVDPMKEPC
jgi:hypothetical protein